MQTNHGDRHALRARDDGAIKQVFIMSFITRADARAMTLYLKYNSIMINYLHEIQFFIKVKITCICTFRQDFNLY